MSSLTECSLFDCISQQIQFIADGFHRVGYRPLREMTFAAKSRGSIHYQWAIFYASLLCLPVRF